jgi:hypothetical protein
MIIKGKSRGNGAQLGQYVITPLENERVEVFEIQGVAATNVPDAVIEMEALAAGTRCDKSLYHASINTRARERMTDDQRRRAIERLGDELGFFGQPYVAVIHEKKGREHLHVVWGRIDIENMRAIPDSHNYRKHEQVARELEREFGHERVQGAHAERDGKPRPERTPSRAEMQQSKRTGMDPRQVKEEITQIWRRTETGQEFADGLSKAGYVLARGDRRDFVMVDREGGTHSLARRIEGVRVKELRERMADIDPSQLPSVTQAKAIQRFRRGAERDLQRREEETKGKDRSAENLDWTNHGGMVSQQNSARKWVKKASELRSKSDRSERDKTMDDVEQTRRERRQHFMRIFGRQPDGFEDRMEQNRGRQRSR